MFVVVIIRHCHSLSLSVRHLRPRPVFVVHHRCVLFVLFVIIVHNRHLSSSLFVVIGRRCRLFVVVCHLLSAANVATNSTPAAHQQNTGRMQNTDRTPETHWPAEHRKHTGRTPEAHPLNINSHLICRVKPPPVHRCLSLSSFVVAFVVVRSSSSFVLVLSLLFIIGVVRHHRL